MEIYQCRIRSFKQILLFCSAFAVAYTAQFLFLVLLVEGLDVNEYLAQFLGLFSRKIPPPYFAAR